MNPRFKYPLLYLIFLIASILGLILTIERYPCLWLKFPHLDVFWKVYLDHFMAGFLIPVWMFIILGGIMLLFNKRVNVKTQKIAILMGFGMTMVLAIIWDFMIPLYLLIKVVIQNSYGFLAFIGAVKLFYWSPRYEFVQFLFDSAGILFSILFIKYFREDLV